MIFTLTEEERMIQSTAREFARKDLAPVAAEANESATFPDGIYAKLGELGFLGMTLPEEYGGVGFGATSLVLVLEEISRVCASTAVTLSVHNSLTNAAILKYGSEELRGRYLPPLASGEILGAYALTEPDAGSDVAAVRTSAERRGDEYVLNGTKIFISTGDKAGAVIVFARTDPAHRTRGMTAFVVEPSFEGFAVGKKEDKMGLRASTTVELVFEDCRVPATNVLGEVGEGIQIALALLDGGRIGIAAQSLGIAQAALDEAVLFARERRQFNTRIADFQATRWKIADMATSLDAARLLVYRAASLRDAGEPVGKEASMAKLFASTAANRIVYDAVQIHGGVGYTREFLVERLFRDARVLEIYEGTSEIQRLVISRNVLEEYDRLYPAE
ncbi:MAG: acyl-CoA dehydrogenase [Candidatus Krumholzibacteriota bacterium]|nr:acyl-CoA dehydrogenase [Candidatus Krumholzibacteriota bacterium]